MFANCEIFLDWSYHVGFGGFKHICVTIFFLYLGTFTVLMFGSGWGILTQGESSELLMNSGPLWNIVHPALLLLSTRRQHCKSNLSKGFL